jgi:hypothetical protein
MVKDCLVVDFAVNVGGMVLGEGLVFLLSFFQEYFEVLGLHQHNRPSDEL